MELTVPPPWHSANCAELRPLVTEHYSRRHPLRPGAHYGGVGSPLYLATNSGSAWIAVRQLGGGRKADWRRYPSWWVSLFHRAADDTLRASELVRLATDIMLRIRPEPAYTAINPRRVQHKRQPGLCFLRANWRYHCCTRPLQRWRSLIIMVKTPS